MGASAWHNFAPFQQHVYLALTQLQEHVITRREYYTAIHNLVKFSSLAELEQAKQVENFWDQGTHSVLDMHKLSRAGASDEPGVIAALTQEETRELLGSDTPTREDFEERIKGDAMWADMTRWCGRYTVLYQDGEPNEYVFWAFSGD